MLSQPTNVNKDLDAIKRGKYISWFPLLEISEQKTVNIEEGK
jgi:hypothetical protein